MRTSVSLLCLVFMLSLATPAQAQLRDDALKGPSPTQLYDQGGPNLLETIFSPEHFRMAHSYEMSFNSFGGNSSSLGMYTSSFMWQFNQALAARVDVSVAQQFSGDAFGNDNTRFFLRNAELAYRPSENMELRVQVQQSPYGAYYSPYGYYNPYRSRRSFHTSFSTSSDDLFWRN